MARSILVAALLASLSALAVIAPAEAGDKYSGDRSLTAQHKSKYHRGTKVRGYVARRGGYSYVYQDVINTYGDSRGRYGAATSLRDPGSDRQTPAGPFDHGFFFDSPVAPHGGESPYRN